MSESAKKASPTPIPWESENGYAGDRLQKYVTAPGKDGFRPWSDADADMIVRAVNAHQALVDALRGLLADEYIQGRIKSVGLGIGTNTEYGRVITDAMAALKLAEGR